MSQLPVNRKADAYEDKHMAKKDDEVVYRDKFVATWPFHLLMLIVTLISALPMLLLPQWWAIFSVAIPLVLVWLLFAVMRVTVTTKRVNIQLGLFGPNVLIDDIISCEDVEYDWKKYGGWGIRHARDGSWAYNMMGDAGRAVKLVYKTPKGDKTVLVTCGETVLVADTIKQLMQKETTASQEEEVVLDFDHAEIKEESAEVASQKLGN